MADRKLHWDGIYAHKSPEEVGWYQAVPALSLGLIRASGIGLDEPIIDVGAGASLLVDHLLDAGFSNIAVLDLSGHALARSQARLGARSGLVTWFEADVTAFAPETTYSLWHDRAVFHFLTEAQDRRDYVAALRRSLKVGGAVIIAAFCPEGPTKCSGLDVVRHDEVTLGRELGFEFELVESGRERHVTPTGSEQAFGYFRYVRVAPAHGRGAKEE